MDGISKKGRIKDRGLGQRQGTSRTQGPRFLLKVTPRTLWGQLGALFSRLFFVEAESPAWSQPRSAFELESCRSTRAASPCECGNPTWGSPVLGPEPNPLPRNKTRTYGPDSGLFGAVGRERGVDPPIPKATDIWKVQQGQFKGIQNLPVPRKHKRYLRLRTKPGLGPFPIDPFSFGWC